MGERRNFKRRSGNIPQHFTALQKRFDRLIPSQESKKPSTNFFHYSIPRERILCALRGTPISGYTGTPSSTPNAWGQYQRPLTLNVVCASIHGVPHTRSIQRGYFYDGEHTMRRLLRESPGACSDRDTNRHAEGFLGGCQTEARHFPLMHATRTHSPRALLERPHQGSRESNMEDDVRLQSQRLRTPRGTLMINQPASCVFALVSSHRNMHLFCDSVCFVAPVCVDNVPHWMNEQ